MVDGKFYDASIYKATPVPMALEPDTVYEAERTGVPAGLFTVTKAAEAGGTWLGDGMWMEAGAKPPSTGRKAETKPREEEEDKPPVLRRPGAEPPAQAKPAETQGGTNAQASPTPPKTSESAPAESGQPEKSAAPTQPSGTDDSERPRLRRGTPEQHPSAPKETAPSTPAPAEHVSPARSSPPKAQPQQLPAISDAGGPDPRPYTYELKPREEREFRQKMLALAATEALKRQTAPMVSPSSSGGKKKSAAPGAQPQFQNVNLKVFDLSSSNEPVLVLSATESAASRRDVLLVARTDLYGELRTIFFGVTDARHLDLSPRRQLIDAVDADGDGRGELLFRQTSDAGSAYAVYRVTPDRLVPLFEGVPAGQ
jgi:hypothetical protein